MGQEKTCKFTYDRKAYTAKVHLDSNSLTIRGDLRLAIPLKDVKEARVSAESLHLTWDKQTLVLELGKDADKWKQKILHPPSLLDRLGVKATSIVSLIRVTDETFLTLLRDRTGSISVGRLQTGSDIVLVGAENPGELEDLRKIRKAIKPNGAVWIIWTKGRKDFNEANVSRAAKEHGFVDVKVASFSGVLSALKVVIPVLER